MARRSVLIANRDCGGDDGGIQAQKFAEYRMVASPLRRRQILPEQASPAQPRRRVGRGAIMIVALGACVVFWALVLRFLWGLWF
jgi:hypothetical protein